MLSALHKCAFLVATGAALAGSGVAYGQVAVDLNTWSKKGPAGNGTWTVAPDGSSVLQSINGNPTFFVSPNTYFNTTVNGRFGVETTSDDDYIGFVFGYQTPQATGTEYDFLLFDWKQLNQSGSTAGFTLSRVQGTGVNLFDNHQTNQAGYTVLATNVGTGRGWADNVVYDFSLAYGSDRISIGINGGSFSNETIFDVALADVDPGGTLFGGSFPSGQFGFYNYSQANVRYQSFTQADDPILSTTPGSGGTLTFPVARVGGASTSASVGVQNAGGIGSELTGAASSLAGVFSGAGGPFDLTQGGSTTFDYAFTPASRGLVSTSLVIQADAPAVDSTITLEGSGVGPVTQVIGHTANVFDFGTIASTDTADLIMNLGNVTTEAGLLSLVGLTVDVEISGLNPGNFSTSLIDGMVFDAGVLSDFSLTFDPAGGGGPFSALLILHTDEGAPFGQTSSGAAYTFQLLGNAEIPEPAALAALAALGAIGWSRRHH